MSWPDRLRDGRDGVALQSPLAEEVTLGVLDGVLKPSIARLYDEPLVRQLVGLKELIQSSMLGNPQEASDWRWLAVKINNVRHLNSPSRRVAYRFHDVNGLK